jgi:hypothetical protein
MYGNFICGAMGSFSTVRRNIRTVFLAHFPLYGVWLVIVNPTLERLPVFRFEQVRFLLPLMGITN